MSLSFSLSLSVFLCLSFCLCLCLSVSLCVSLCLSVCLSVSLSLSLCLCLSVFVSVSVFLSVCLSLSLSLLQAPPYLVIHIGSVDSFERNLERAQAELGIDMANQIPVTYISSPQLVSIVGSWIPTLLIIGAMVYFTRRLTGGNSRRGVSSCLLYSENPLMVFDKLTLYLTKLVAAAIMEAIPNLVCFVFFFREFLESANQQRNSSTKKPTYKLSSGTVR